MLRQTAALILAAFSLSAFAAPEGWVDPLGFKGTAEEQQAVLTYIAKSVRYEYCVILGRCSHTALRVHEEEELRAFKELANPGTNRKVFRQVYKDYCTDIGDCSYSTLELMYRIEIDTAEKPLRW